MLMSALPWTRQRITAVPTFSGGVMKTPRLICGELNLDGPDATDTM
jgi:hypothetical protein